MAAAKLPDLSPFELAKQRWEAARAAHRDLHARLDGARAAYGAIVQPEDPDVPPKSPRLVALAKEYLAGRRASPDRLAAEIAELQEQAAGASDAYAAARQVWDLERSLEQHRVAEVSRPELQAAARRMARLVEKLSAEVTAARELTSGLTEQGVLTQDIGVEFGVLSDFHSPVSQWNRRMLGTGLL